MAVERDFAGRGDQRWHDQPDISVMSGETGAVQERLSYDAWGKRRFANGTDDPTDSITSQTTRGFTGEEELSVSGLVHLNGRVYDPLLARFTSADTITESPYSTQGWNRYSYVGNDPLAYTDPSGHCFLGCFWEPIGHFFSGIGHDITHFFQTNTVARSLLQIGATLVLSVALPGLGLAAGTALTVASAAGGAIIATGLSGGNLAQVLKAGLIAGVTTFAFGEIGPGNLIGSAAIGCVSTVAAGAKCAAGALSAAVGALLSPVSATIFPNSGTDFGQRIGGTIIEATAGGIASVAGGGKFENGALTAAFGYLAKTSLEDVRRDPMDAFDAELPGIGDNGGPPLQDPADLSRMASIVSSILRMSPIGIVVSVVMATSTPGDLPVLRTPEFDFNDPTSAPTNPDGTPWQWRGPDAPGGERGGYVNPANPDQSMHPNLDHGDPIGPHWDFTDRKFGGWRIGLDGRVLPN